MPIEVRITRRVLWFSRLFYFFITVTLCQRDRHCWDDCVIGIVCLANSNGDIDVLTRHILAASSSRPWCSLYVRRPFCSSLSSISSNLESCILMKGISINCSQAAYVADLSIGHSLSYWLDRVEMGHGPIKKKKLMWKYSNLDQIFPKSIVYALNVQQNNPH